MLSLQVRNTMGIKLFIVALFVTAKDWKQPKCLSVGDSLSELWHMHMIEYCAMTKRMRKFSCIDITVIIKTRC